MKRVAIVVAAVALVWCPSLGSAPQTWVRYPIAPASVRAEIVAIADMNVDGWDDVVYTSWDNCQVRLATNNQNGTFTDSLLIGSATQCVPALFQARNVEVAFALGGRTVPQVFVSAYQGGQHMYVEIGGTWTKFTIDSSTYGHAGIAVAHINQDGLPDVVTAKQGFSGAPGEVKVWKNLDSGQFQLMDSFVVQDPTGVVIADVDKDGSNDVVVSDSDGALWFRNGGGFTFPLTGSAILRGVGSTSKVTAADLDRDGRTDYIVVSQASGVYTVNGTSLGSGTLRSSANGGYFAATGFVDYPDDGQLDFGVSYGGPSHRIDFFRRVGGSYAVETVTTNYVTGRSIAVADLLHDGTRQLVTSSYGDGTVDWWKRQ